MRSIKCDLPEALTGIELIPLADMHIGDACCDFALIKERINYIRDTGPAYCILNGDLMDSAIASSIGDTIRGEFAAYGAIKGLR